MRCVVISDLHLGADNCSLVELVDNQRRLTNIYQLLIRTIREHDARLGGTGVDYLVLLGDVMDLSVASQGDAYDAARVFFQHLAAERASRDGFLIKQLVYVPGNHDFSVWRTVMHEANVVNRLNKGVPVVDRWSSPGLIDDRSSAGAQRGRINIPRVSKQPDGGYGGMYLDALTRTPGRRAEDEPRLVFNIVYPNLYVIDERNTTLLTHGHYLETPWALTGNLIREIAGKDLHLLHGEEASIDEIVALNLPFAELTSASLGMSGPFMAVARAIQREYKARGSEGHQKLTKIREYIGRAKKIVDDRVLPKDGFIREKLSDYGLDKVEQTALARLEKARPARANDAFPEPALVQSYHGATDLERDMLARAYGLGVPEVTHIVVGHSHRYARCGGPEPRTVRIARHGSDVAIANTGGWLAKDCQLQGGIMFYDHGAWSSEVITT